MVKTILVHRNRKNELRHRKRRRQAEKGEHGQKASRHEIIKYHMSGIRVYIIPRLLPLQAVDELPS